MKNIKEMGKNKKKKKWIGNHLFYGKNVDFGYRLIIHVNYYNFMKLLEKIMYPLSFYKNMPMQYKDT
jgi:hypothetical protein